LPSINLKTIYQVNYKILIPVFLSILVFNACSTAQFDRIPNFNQLSSFPPSMEGKYFVAKEKKSNSDSGYFSIKGAEIDFVDLVDFKINSKIGLSDTLKLLKDGDIFILAWQTPDKQWELYPLKIKKECIFLYPISDARYKKSLQKNFKTQLDISNGYFMDDLNLRTFIRKGLKSKYSVKLEK